MQYMFADDIFNVGRVKVWFHVSRYVYKRLPVQERERCHELVLEWFSVFERQCPDIYVQHMRIMWEEFRRRNDVLNWKYKYLDHAVLIQLFTRCRREHMSGIDTDMNTGMNADNKNTVFLCVQCGREFYHKEYLLRHSLVHKACVYCGKTSPKHKCHKTSTPNLTKEESLKPYLNSFHYKMYSNVKRGI